MCIIHIYMNIKNDIFFQFQVKFSKARENLDFLAVFKRGIEIQSEISFHVFASKRGHYFLRDFISDVNMRIFDFAAKRAIFVLDIVPFTAIYKMEEFEI